MKKLLALILVLGLATVANATLSIRVNGAEAGDEITVSSGTEVTISVYSDGTVVRGDVATQMSIGGDGSFDITGATNSLNGPGFEDTIWEDSPGVIAMDLSILDGPPPSFLPSGTLINMIMVTTDGPGDMVLSLFDAGLTYGILDGLTIHVPEPITLALLGLGGLFIRRK